jgi:acylphosphatase
MTRPAARLVIQGRVQGVGFRWWTLEAAQRFGLAGWVRNCGDGSVEVLAIGGEDAIGRLAQVCLKGPPGARVDKANLYWVDDDGSTDFTQRETQ